MSTGRRVLMVAGLCAITGLVVMIWVRSPPSVDGGPSIGGHLDGMDRVPAPGVRLLDPEQVEVGREPGTDAPPGTPLVGKGIAGEPGQIELPFELNAYTFSFPSTLQNWIDDPRLNTSGWTECADAAVTEFRELAARVQGRVGQLQQAHLDARTELAHAKAGSATDVALGDEPWPAGTLMKMSVGGMSNGKRIEPKTVYIRRGDSADLDEVDGELRRAIDEGLAEARAIAGRGCSR